MAWTRPVSAIVVQDLSEQLPCLLLASIIRWDQEELERIDRTHSELQRTEEAQRVPSVEVLMPRATDAEVFTHDMRAPSMWQQIDQIVRHLQVAVARGNGIRARFDTYDIF